jgi:hypothetical protein
MVEIGDAVIFVDPYGREHNAIVTTTFQGGGHPGDDGPRPAVNLVYVSSDDSQTDQYGRQIARNTSVVHQSNQSAHGMFWREMD